MKQEAHDIVGQIETLAKPSTVDAITPAIAGVASKTSRLQVLLAEEQAKSAAIMERQTKQLIRLTWGLFVLTAVLLAVEVRAVFFPQNLSANPEHVQASQNQQVVIPPVPK